jgi:hypothetical protein
VAAVVVEEVIKVLEQTNEDHVHGVHNNVGMDNVDDIVVGDEDAMMKITGGDVAVHKVTQLQP